MGRCGPLRASALTQTTRRAPHHRGFSIKLSSSSYIPFLCFVEIPSCCNFESERRRLLRALRGPTPSGPSTPSTPSPSCSQSHTHAHCFHSLSQPVLVLGLGPLGRGCASLFLQALDAGNDVVPKLGFCALCRGAMNHAMAGRSLPLRPLRREHLFPLACWEGPVSPQPGLHSQGGPRPGPVEGAPGPARGRRLYTGIVFLLIREFPLTY